MSYCHDSCAGGEDAVFHALFCGGGSQCGGFIDLCVLLICIHVCDCRLQLWPVVRFLQDVTSSESKCLSFRSSPHGLSVSRLCGCTLVVKMMNKSRRK